MANIFSTTYSKASHSLAMLILRISIGSVMLPRHGWHKLTHFSEMQGKFMDFMGLGTQISLGLAVFAEFFCAIFIIIGLFTRLATIPLIILFVVAITMSHNGDIFHTAQLPFVLLAGFVVILLLGPGKISIDRLISKK